MEWLMIDRADMMTGPFRAQSSQGRGGAGGGRGRGQGGGVFWFAGH